MSFRKPHTIVKVDKTEAHAIDIQFQELYENKLESEYRNNSGTNQRFIYQVQEVGEKNFSSTGSPSVAITLSFKNKFNTVLYANAHARDNSFIASVTDITQSAMTITMRSISGSLNFSNV